MLLFLDPGSGLDKIQIRDKHPGSATPGKSGSNSTKILRIRTTGQDSQVPSLLSPPCALVANLRACYGADPHNFGKSDRNEKLDPDPYQSQNLGAMKAQNGGVDAHTEEPWRTADQCSQFLIALMRTVSRST